MCKAARYCPGRLARPPMVTMPGASFPVRNSSHELARCITVDPNILVGKPIVKGTRISVEFVIDLLSRGWTADQILREYDHLAQEDVQACLAYASDVLKSEKGVFAPPAR